MLTSLDRPTVAAMLARGWAIARTTDGDSIRNAFARNLAATSDPTSAAILSESWAVAKTIDGDRIRDAFAKNLAATGDAEVAAVLTRGWTLARTADGSSLRSTFAKNLAATGDAWAAAELTSGWAIAGTINGDSIRSAYVKNLAATNDARAAARLTSGWAAAKVVDGTEVRDAYARNLAATSDARAAAELTRAWTVRRSMEAPALHGDSLRSAYAKNLVHTGDVGAAAQLTSGWVLRGDLAGDGIRSAWTTSMQRLRRHDPEALATADQARARLRAGTGSDDDLRQLFEMYGATEVRDSIPELRWRAITQLFEMSTERNDVTRVVPGLLADARDHLARLRAAPETAALRQETSELIERNLARITGDHAGDMVRGYGDHADYAEVGRIVSSMSLLDELDTPIRTRPAVPATPIDDIVPW